MEFIFEKTQIGNKANYGILKRKWFEVILAIPIEKKVAQSLRHNIEKIPRAQRPMQHTLVDLSQLRPCRSSEDKAEEDHVS